MEFVSDQGRERYQALVSLARDVVVGVDFDGTLAPIVDDPGAAWIHPVAPDVLTRLAAVVAAVVVVTGRPARQVVELGGLEEIADALPEGARLEVMGQYGHERWDSADRTFSSPEPPEALRELRQELPEILAQQRAVGAEVEDKGLALAVHT
ncbi:MAG: trehalose-phosphatase, partial [Nocardioidaceae bacterium]